MKEKKSMSPEYTGPPIGDPPEHVHEDTPAVEAVEEAVSSIDEQLVELLEKTDENNTKVLKGVEECQNRLNNLLEKFSTELRVENPMLTEILLQLRELRDQIMNLKSSMDSRQRNQPQNVSEMEEEPVPSDSLNPESPTEEVENPEPERKRKAKFA
jgi:chromosome segregation ATPase